MTNKYQPVLVLDLDGTLIDSKPDLVAALNVAIKSVGLSPLPDTIVGDTVGQGALAMIKRAHNYHGRNHEDQQIAEMFDIFLDYYTNNIAVHSKPFPGVQNALDRFVNNGWLLAICSNKPERLAKLLLQSFEMDSQFSAICGKDTFDVSKPDAGHLLKTIEMAGSQPNGCVMVGDTATDINTAINAELPCVAVDFGYSAEPVNSLGATRIISHFDQLWSAVEAL